MPVPGADYGVRFGPNALGINGLSTQAMAALNTGVVFRFLATSTKDIKSVTIRWQIVSAPGTVQLRVETVDAATGKPTGTLYDANAVYNITPVLGVQTYTFATPPTTGLVVGDMYAIVLLTTVAGTTQTLAAYISSADSGTYPINVMTATDGTTRSNFVEVANARPACSVVLDDDTEGTFGFYNYLNTSSFPVYTTGAGATKFNLSTALNIAGVLVGISLTGTPAGDLRVRIFDSNNNVVSGTLTTLDKDALLAIGTAGRMAYAPFVNIVSLPAGNYRVIADSPDSVNSSNCYNVRTLTFSSISAVGTNFKSSTTLNITASPIVWTDSSTNDGAMQMFIDSIPAGGLKVHPGMSGGLNG